MLWKQVELRWAEIFPNQFLLIEELIQHEEGQECDLNRVDWKALNTHWKKIYKKKNIFKKNL